MRDAFSRSEEFLDLEKGNVPKIDQKEILQETFQNLTRRKCIVAKSFTEIGKCEISTTDNDKRIKSEVLSQKRFRHEVTHGKSVKKTRRVISDLTGPKGFDPLTTGLEVQHSIQAELQAQIPGN